MIRALTIYLLALLASGAGAQETTSALPSLLGDDAEGFPKAIEPRVFDFPADHGPHPEFRNEWWYVTGNLDAEDGRRFGFELTFFRFALTPSMPDQGSNWRTNQVYIAHLALTDARGQRFLVDERYSRGALGLAGAEADPFRVWIDDWQIAARPGVNTRWVLTAASDDFALNVELKALKPPALNGDAGLSQKSDKPGNASYYYSMTRWATDGSVTIGDQSLDVRGLSWLDREWSSSALDDGQQGWDWFALQLDDGSELMVYNLRRTDGSQDRNSAGTFIAADGAYEHLVADDIRIRVTDTWESPKGGRYPARWTVDVPRLDLSLEVAPVIADQELFTTVRYWEGAVDVKGTQSGRGYVELTGYAD
jgi:predicted secreted hydrolase